MSAGNYAGLQYYAAVLGPNGVSVPIDLAYTLTLTVTGGEQGSSYIALNPSGHDAPPLKQLTTGAGSSLSDKTIGHVTDMTISGVLNDTVMSNTEFDIAELVRLTGNGTGRALVDPVLTIDPSFASVDPNYLTDFQVVLSSGVGNAEIAAVPEPATVGIFGTGLLGTFALRRRKRKA